MSGILTRKKAVAEKNVETFTKRYSVLQGGAPEALRRVHLVLFSTTHWSLHADMSNAARTAKKAVRYAKPSAKLINSKLKQEQSIKAERNKLALASVKDIFAILNPNAGSDEDFDLTDFDCKVYFANPRAFDKLPFFKQAHVVEEMNELLKKNWKSLDKDVKRFAVWWAYGSHGPREGFVELHDYYTPYGVEAEEVKEVKDETPVSKATDTELDKIIDTISEETTKASSQSEKSALQMSSNELEASHLNKRPELPPDLPFKLPSILQTFRPTASTMVHRYPALDPRSFGLKRLQQYRQDRRMNPINRIVLVVLVFLTVLCFKQDRRVNVTGTVPEYPWDVAEHEEKEAEEKRQQVERGAEEAQRELASQAGASQDKKGGRRWYYLWLF